MRKQRKTLGATLFCRTWYRWLQLAAATAYSWLIVIHRQSILDAWQQQEKVYPSLTDQPNHLSLPASRLSRIGRLCLTPTSLKTASVGSTNPKLYETTNTLQLEPRLQCTECILCENRFLTAQELANLLINIHCGSKRWGHFVLRLVALKVLIRLAQNLAQMNVISFLTLP